MLPFGIAFENLKKAVGGYFWTNESSKQEEFDCDMRSGNDCDRAHELSVKQVIQTMNPTRHRRID